MAVKAERLAQHRCRRGSAAIAVQAAGERVIARRYGRYGAGVSATNAISGLRLRWEVHRECASQGEDLSNPALAGWDTTRR